ncbi:MAG: YdcF family protein [Lachnospiraceae bacterium]|nr:YdcF family protein [Lachnospiraceae bacterium]
MKKKEELIPPGKGKKTIYLDRRTYEGEKRIFPAVVFFTVAVLSVFYCIGIALMANFGTYFFLIWGVIAVISALLGLLMLSPHTLNRIPDFLKYFIVGVFCICFAVFAVTELTIISHFNDTPFDGADYVIVLGAQMRENGPSRILQYRLDAAITYLEKNPRSLVIASGGQGYNESVTESEGMKEYLLSRGISEDRILLEDKSTNTYENLKNSAELFDMQKDRIVIVTNNFHVFRACAIAKKMGYERAYGLAAGSYAPLVPNNLLREFLGVMKDLFYGNI